MNVSIIIPTFNGFNLLSSHLPSVINAAKEFAKETEIIIVDDGSTDKTEEKITEHFLKDNNALIKFFRNEKNQGFSSSVNLGVSHAKGEIAILLNTDVIPRKNFIEPLVSHFNNEKVFAVGCMDESVENDKVVLRGRGIGKWEKGFLVHSRGEVDKTNTLWVNGGSGAFRKSMWDKLGGFNSLYNPFYWEDIDLSYRALKSGYDLVFEAKSTVRHEHDKGSIKKHYSSFQVKTIAYRNQFIFVWENATDFSLQVAHGFWLFYHFITAVMRKDMAFFTGFFQALILLPRILASSFRSQKKFVKTDREVVSIFWE